MPLLRMRNASFIGGGCSVGPLTIAVWPGERAALTLASAGEARLAARLASGIVKASSGRVLIGDYDPRVQSIHCKRIVAFVPHEPMSLSEPDFVRYIAYRAALWNVDARRAGAYAAFLRERLGEMHEAFAYPLIGALIAMPELVVLDRPAPVYAKQILGAIEARTVFSTHTNAAAARAFERPAALRMTQA
jgi:hypothetical protein